ncbi:MAG: hypothetical protein HQL62_05970, partial [Magnetococcales bacterium]|nr:hypothetical protein [Magnetococcales bacterium]
MLTITKPDPFAGNPLFVRYGQAVSRLFAETTREVTPDQVTATLGIEALPGGDRFHEAKQLSNYHDPADLDFMRTTICELKNKLVQEQEESDQGTACSGENLRYQTPVTQKLKEFREALDKKNEAMLEENPFYELAGLLWRSHLRAIQKAFAEHVATGLDGMPHPIKVARSFLQIWRSRREVTSLREKSVEIVGKIASIGKWTLGLLLFVGSTLTTAKGVSDLVQLPALGNFFGGYLASSQHEHLRMVFSIMTGLTLSSVILDFKSRLFQGVAETGRVFPGYWLTFRINPRWTVIALFLTMLSIWTNYDGIVLILSKTEDLSWQWKKIQKQVETGMGDSSSARADNPSSLWDLHALLDKNMAQAVARFHQVPLDEMSGAASSGIAVKGPRYWGKYHIVHGEYQPGHRDVSSQFPNSSVAAQIDGMLRGSRLNLQVSLEKQMLDLLVNYRQHLLQTQDLVQQKMGALERMMSIQSFSFRELYTFFSLESYHVDNKVKEIVGSLENSKARFTEVVEQLNRLTSQYIALLVQVDQAGGVVRNKYDIKIDIQIPSLESIDQLKQGKIPGVQRRNLEELKGILLERHGLALGGTFLFLILFVAISMDLSDPIFYSAMVARWGRRDRRFLDENLQRFEKWEKELVQNFRIFLIRPDIRTALADFPCPPMPMVYWIYHLFLEDMDAAVKDDRSFSLMERFRYWFAELFQTTRLRFVKGYNARLGVEKRILSNPDVYGFLLLNRLYGGLFTPFRVGIDHFEERHRLARQETSREKLFFSREFTLHSQGVSVDFSGETSSSNKVFPFSRLHASPFLHRVRHLAGKIKQVALILCCRNLSGEDLPFPLSRYNWLRQQAILELRSQKLREALSPLDPVLTDLLGTVVPGMKADILDKLEKSLQEIPNHPSLKQGLGIGAIIDSFHKLELGMLSVFGMLRGCAFQLNEKTLRMVVESADCPEIAQAVMDPARAGSLIGNRLSDLHGHLRHALMIVQKLLSDRSQVVTLLSGIRNELLRPIQKSIEPLHIRDVFEKAIGLDQMRHE